MTPTRKMQEIIQRTSRIQSDDQNDSPAPHFGYCHTRKLLQVNCPPERLIVEKSTEISVTAITKSTYPINKKLPLAFSRVENDEDKEAMWMKLTGAYHILSDDQNSRHD